MLLLLSLSTHVYAVTITISGTLYSDEGSTPITSADQTIHLVIDGVSIGTDVIDASGNYSISATLTPANPYYLPLLVYVDDELIQATTVTQMDSVLSNTLANFDLYTNHLILRQDGSSAPLDTGDMHNAKGSLTDPDILYSISWPDTTVTGNNTALYIANGYAYEPAGNVTTHHMQIEGTLNANNKTFHVNGDWDMTNGIFNRDTSTVNFTGTGTIRNDTAPWWSKSFYNVNAAAAGQITTIALGQGIVVKNLLSLETGTIAGGVVVLNKAGTAFVTAGATLTNSQFKYSPPAGGQVDITTADYPNLWLAENSSANNSTFSLLGEITCNTLQINGNGSDKVTTLNTAGHNITCNNLAVGSTNNRKGRLILDNSVLTIHNDVNIVAPDTGTNELDAGSSTLNIGGDWINNSAFTAGTSNVLFNGTSNQFITSGSDPFYNLTLNNTGNILTLQDPLTVNNDLTITTGKLDTSNINNQPITVLRHFNQSNTGEVEANESIITVSGDFNVDGTLDSTNYNNASVILNGAGSLFYGNIFQRWRNGFNNLTVGQAGQTTSSNNTFAVLNELTVGSGAFTGGSFVYLGSGSSNATLNLDPNATISINELRFFGANQIIPNLPNGYDSNIRLSRGNLTLTQSGDITLNTGNHLLIDGDGFVDRALTYNTNGFDLTIGGGLQLGAGGDTALKTLNISNSTVTVDRDFDIRTGTNTLVSTNSTVILDGTIEQTVTMNGNFFDTLNVSNPTGAGVIFNDGFTANTFINTEIFGKMTFASGETYTINNAVTLQGASGQVLTLAASSPGTHWNFVLNNGATKAIDYVNVSWSDASGSHSSQKRINPSNSLDNGNTIDWFYTTLITVDKEATLISDPINGSGATKNHIPGAIVEYNITTRNAGTASPDVNTVIIYDNLDANVEYDVATGVVFSDGSTSSALTLGTVSYSHRNTPNDYSYAPTGAFDPNVASLKIETNGIFAFGGSPIAEFNVKFRVRIK